MRVPHALFAVLFILSLMSGVAAWAQGTATPAEEVLVEGDPALTVGMVERFTGFLEWALEAPMTVQQRAELRAQLVDSWQQKRQDDIAGMMEMLGLEEQVAAHPADERDLLREQIQPQLLAALRETPDDEGCKFLLGVYDAAHEPIADGDPPLTRQVSDAYAEVLFFMVNQVMGSNLELTPEFRDGFAQSLAGSYAQYDARGRQHLAQMPMFWAAIRVAWPALSAEEQEAMRKQWEPGIVALVRPAAPPAGEAQPAASAQQPLPTGDVKAYLDRAAASYQQGQWQAVVEDCTAAIRLDPNCAMAYLTRAKAYAAMFKDQQVIEDCTRAIQLDPQNAEAYSTRSSAYYGVGERDLADQDRATMRQLRGQGPAPGQTGDATIDALAKLQDQQNTYNMVMNISRMQYETSSIISGNIGGWHTTYRYGW